MSLAPIFLCKYRTLLTIHTKKQSISKHTGLEVMLKTYIQVALGLNLSQVISYPD
jgi:hypothetical protein